MSLDVGTFKDDDGRSYTTGPITLQTIQLALTRVEASIFAVRTDIHYIREAQLQKSTEVGNRFADQETRLRVLEGKRYIEAKSVTTVIALVLPICALAVSIIGVVVR
jgi:hypothetical protein